MPRVIICVVSSVGLGFSRNGMKFPSQHYFKSPPPLECFHKMFILESNNILFILCVYDKAHTSYIILLGGTYVYI